jgi:hypothetical protein
MQYFPIKKLKDYNIALKIANWHVNIKLEKTIINYDHALIPPNDFIRLLYNDKNER